MPVIVLYLINAGVLALGGLVTDATPTDESASRTAVADPGEPPAPDGDSM